MAGQWLLLDVQGLGLRLAWDLQVVTSRVGLFLTMPKLIVIILRLET